jgi:hypothetical protein
VPTVVLKDYCHLVEHRTMQERGSELPRPRVLCSIGYG